MMTRTMALRAKDSRASVSELHRSGTALIALVLLSAVLAAGCGKPEAVATDPPPSKAIAVSPEVLLEYPISGGYVGTAHPASAISSDGKYFLAENYSDQSTQLVAYPLQSGLSPKVLFEIPGDWVKDNFTQLFPLGWITGTKCAFAYGGWQDRGPHKDSRGVALYVVDLETGSAEEAGYIDLPNGRIVSSVWFPEKLKGYLHITSSVWEFDGKSNSVRLVRDGLPVYDGLFTVTISPNGDYGIYQLNEDTKKGIYILDLSTGEERALLPAGDSLSFYPEWSPDGKYVVAYTAGKSPPEPGDHSSAQYDVIEGEDGPAPAAKTLTIVDTGGKTVKTASVEGQYLLYPVWSQDSGNLAFATGTLPSTASGPVGLSLVKYTGIWSTAVSSQGGPSKIAELDQSPVSNCMYLRLVHFDSKSQSVFFTAFERSGAQNQAGNPSVYLASDGQGLTKVADGHWLAEDSIPAYGEFLAGILSQMPDQKYGLWLFAPGKSKEFASMDATESPSVVCYNEELFGVLTRGKDGKASEVVIYRMVKQ